MNTDNPLVSVCCLTYNQSKFIRATIESIWNQNYKNIELIVLDDGSTDGSGQLLDDLAKISPVPMTVLRQENSGNIAYNMNRTIKLAKGKYIALLSLDDIWLAEAVSKPVSIMEQDDDIQFVTTSQLQEIDDNGNPRKHRERVISRLADIKETIDDLINLDYQYFHSYYMQGTLLRKSLIDAIGGYDENVQGDDIVLRSKIAFYMKEHPQMKFKIIHDTTFLYRVHNSSIAANPIRQYETVRDFINCFHPNDKTPKRYKNFCFRLVQQGKIAYFFSEIKTNPRIRWYVLLVPYWLVRAAAIKIYKAFKR
ncbi:MAG: glycosyltransferase [Candidatus Gastranaerophilales bacterium]|nr:glycosyltransferase [Candidatus Gastranaerophilales bacterium]